MPHDAAKFYRTGSVSREDGMINKTRRRFGGSILALSLVLLAQAAAAQTAPVTLIAYTSLQKEVLAPYEAAFRKAHPEIQIAWVRDAGGVIHSRLLDRKSVV